MTNFKKVAWFTATTIPFAVWLLLYKAWNESILFVESVSIVFGSILLSLVAVAVLVFLKYFDKENFKKAKWTKAFIILFGTPVTFLFAWAYVTFIPMSYQWTQVISTSHENYSLSKYQNFFKSKYIYHETNSDTLIITVTRGNRVKSIKRLRNGVEIAMDFENIPNKEKLVKVGLFRYDK